MLNISPAPTSAAGLTFGAITPVQSASANTGAANASATSVTLTFGQNLTPGNIVIVATGVNSGVTCKALDPNAANLTYFSSAGTATGPTISNIGLLPVQSAGTGMTVSLSSGLAFNCAVVGVEYSGAKLRMDFSPVATNSGTATTSPATATAVAASPHELLVAIFVTRGTFAAEQTAWLTAPTNSFSSVLQTSTFTNVANADRAVAVCTRVVSSAGNYSTAGTQPNAAYATLISSYVSD